MVFTLMSELFSWSLLKKTCEKRIGDKVVVEAKRSKSLSDKEILWNSTYKIVSDTEKAIEDKEGHSECVFPASIKKPWVTLFLLWYLIVDDLL